MLGEPCWLELPYAMLGGNGTIQTIDDFIDHGIGILTLRDQASILNGIGIRQIEVQIAIADVAEGNNADARKTFLQCG